MSSGAGKPSEVAQVIALLVPFLPEETADSLHRLLGHDVAAPTPNDLRETRLGLLISLIRESQGAVPSTRTYEEARGRASRHGEGWPAHSTLVRAYGHWLAAVRAAMRLFFDGGKARVAGSHRHSKWHAAYTQPEVLNALAQCRWSLADWPTQWDYE